MSRLILLVELVETASLAATSLADSMIVQSLESPGRIPPHHCCAKIAQTSLTMCYVCKVSLL